MPSEVRGEINIFLLRHRQISWKDVEERRDVGRALDGRMSAQREDPAARPPDVAEEQLQDRSGADDLHASGVLRPAHGVTDSRGFVAAGRARENIGDFEKRVLRHAAELLDQRRRVSREVPLENLKDAARMLQRSVSLAFV